MSEMNRVLIGLFAVVLLLTGCGEETTPSVDLMAIRKINDEKQVIQYGMSRTEAEKIVGEGTPGSYGYTKYKSGVRIGYRNDRVAALAIFSDDYETGNGVRLGMTKEEVRKIYGHKAPDFDILSWVYDSETNSYLTDVPASAQDKEAAEKVYIFQVAFDKNGYSTSIILADVRGLFR